MKRGVFRKAGEKNGDSYFTPACPESEKWARTIAIGDHVFVDHRRPRNIKHHRLFFALLNKVFANQEHFKSVDELRFALMIRLGRVKEIRLKGSEVHLMPESINFESMDQDEFRELFESAVNFILTEVIPGLDRDDLMEEIGDMIS